MKTQNQSSIQRSVLRLKLFPIKERIAVGKKYLGRKASDKEALDFFHQFFCMQDCVSLDDFADALKIPGGAQAMEGLLMAAGFLTGAYRSIHSHLPYQRFLDRGYFRVSNKTNPKSKFKCLTFYVTKKGLGPVLKKLKQFGLQIPEHVEGQIKFNINFDEMRSHRD